MTILETLALITICWLGIGAVAIALLVGVHGWAKRGSERVRREEGFERARQESAYCLDRIRKIQRMRQVPPHVGGRVIARVVFAQGARVRDEDLIAAVEEIYGHQADIAKLAFAEEARRLADELNNAGRGGAV